MLYLAPIKGITDKILRDNLSKFFGGIDSSIAPFILVPSAEKFDDILIDDVIDFQNQILPVIPQIICKSPQIARVITQKLIALGHKQVNLNFSCPFPVVINKGRGSALLKDPDQIRKIVESIIDLPIKVSIKIRLGFDDFAHSKVLLEILEGLNIEKVFVHARLATQKYSGKVHWQKFNELQKISEFTLVYNGDLKSIVDYKELINNVGEQPDLMIGRGAIYNPFIFQLIKGAKFTRNEESEIFYKFVIDLFSQYEDKLGDYVVWQVKALWKYFQFGIDDKEYNHKFFRIESLAEMSKMIADMPEWSYTNLERIE